VNIVEAAGLYIAVAALRAIRRDLLTVYRWARP
jgi:hypothetical protein